MSRLVVDLGDVRVDLAPGSTASVAVRSFSDTAKAYALNVTLTRGGVVRLWCSCPAYRYGTDGCKHTATARQILVARGVIDTDDRLIDHVVDTAVA